MARSTKALLAMCVFACLSLGCGLIDLAGEVFGRLPTPLTLYVSTSGNDGNDCLSEARPCLTIHAALAKSTLSSIIHIGAGEFVEESGIILDRGIALIGAGAEQTTLRANSLEYVLQVEGANLVEIRELGIAGLGGESVGVNVTNGTRVTLENCRVTESRTGIAIERSGTATIDNCAISANRVGLSIGGGTAHVLNYYGDSTPSTWHGSAVINGGSFTENTITAISNDGILYLTDVTLRQNIAALDNRGYATIRGSTFDTNGQSYGGVTITNSGQTSISESTLSNNYAIAILNDVQPYLISAFGETYDPSERRPDLNIYRVQIFDNNGRLGKPCAIVNARGSLEVSQSIIRNNNCLGLDLYKGRVEILRSSIVANRGGGVEARGESSVLVENTTISGNYGYAVEVDDDTLLTLVNVTVAFNHRTGIIVNAGHLDIWDSVVALNPYNCIGTVVDRTVFACNDSWTETTLGLGRLTFDEGTPVHPLLPGSPLIDAGEPEYGECLPNDQNGERRPQGLDCDVGAYESSFTAAALVYVTPSGGVPGVVPLYTPTPVMPSAPLLTFIQQANCRQGPNTLYPALGFGQIGQQAQIEGLSDPAGWYYVQLPNGVTRCFVAGSTGTVTGPVDGLSVIPAPPLPVAPAAPVLNVSTKVCDSSEYVVRLSWKDVDGEDGYRVYRDGTLIVTLGADVTSYDDTSPDYNAHDYRVEASNAVDSSSSATRKSEGCLY